MFAVTALLVCGLVAVQLSQIEARAFPFQLNEQVLEDDDYSSRPYERAAAVKRKTNSVSSLRNCFFSPVQCLLPVDNKNFNAFNKRRFF